MWIALLAGGLGVLSAYASNRGDAGVTPAVLPVQFGSSVASDEWTVALAAHPKCPCTRSSIAELKQALDGASEPYRLVVLAYEPPSVPGFANTAAFRALDRDDQTEVVIDTDGALAEQIGGITSGFVAVYDPDGNLRFAGGVTPTRAHTGPNTGAAAVRALLNNNEPPATDAPVYGCPIRTNPMNTQLSAHPLGACTEGSALCQP